MSESDDDDSSSCQSIESPEDELFEHCKYEDISEERIQEIIERFGNQPVGNCSFFRAALSNETVTEGIIQCLLEYFPVAANYPDDDGLLPLHYALTHCKNVSTGIIQLLIDAAPDSVRHTDNSGYMPLHWLCNNDKLDETFAVATLRLLLEKYPDSTQHVDNTGLLPIHIAATSKSPEFCGLLIEAYPRSERIASHMGMLPIHCACLKNSVDVVEYLYNLYPDSINHATQDGAYPIHFAISTSAFRIGTPLDKNEALKIVKFLIGCDPNVKFQECKQGESLLHLACRCDHGQSSTIVALGIIEAIYNAQPEFIRKEDVKGKLPLHKLCANSSLDNSNSTAMAILRLLLEKYPESIRHADNDGYLPIHGAAGRKSPEFCRVLIEAYPGSERIADDKGMLPIHCACINNTVETVEFLYNLYPDAINESTPFGMYPIHAAVRSVADRKDNPEAAVDVVKFLLDCDPSVKFQKLQGDIHSLVLAAVADYTDANVGAAMDVIKAIFDADPEVIGHESLRRDDIVLHPDVRAFVNRQLAYFRHANNTRLMTAPFSQSPLHMALPSDYARLGSIKLLVKGNPLAVQTPNNSGALPLHVACMHHKVADVVEYLIELDTTTLDAVDYEGNTALHYACRSANYEAIALLLEKYDAVSVSKRNAEGKLPIEILWEKEEEDEDEDSFYDSFEESVENTEYVFRLLRAYPEMMNYSACE